ncbi:hypothetical protein [uncultured Jannaschia sp.]|uniref:hypothetical protein n=1 Tax=uncultured Jannaschia sp. TaxID=293347 RepID=UPI0026123D47|nr:hypothetical protein [uncultured Jannaschia sp.]
MIWSFAHHAAVAREYSWRAPPGPEAPHDDRDPSAAADHRGRDYRPYDRHIDSEEQKTEGQHPKPKKRKYGEQAAKDQKEGERHARQYPTGTQQNADRLPQNGNLAFQHCKLPYQSLLLS